MDTLNISHLAERTRCADELTLICNLNKLTRCVEAQETPGRKARAYQLAPRWQKARMREWRKMRDSNNKVAEEAFRRWQNLPWLSQSLEQEAVQELGHIPSSRQDFALLQERNMRAARRGHYKSWALRNTIHALQACAAAWNKELSWSAGRAPPKRLLKFLVEVLRAAKIKHSSLEMNKSKFIALMLRPKKQSSAGPSGTPPEPSELERRLAKVFL